MKNYFFTLLFITITLHAGHTMKKLYDFNATLITGQKVSMEDYKGKVLLIVNVASECTFTPQYKGLETLYKKYRASGFEILAFPSNQFAHQEPKNEKEIQKFCSVKYGVTFDLFEKIKVNGKHADPLYKFLKKKATGFLGTQSIKWNFTKFLVDKEGNILKRYGSTTKPKKIEKEIKLLLSI